MPMQRRTVAVWTIVAILCALPLIALLGGYIYFGHDLPRIGSLQDYRPSLVTQVYSRRGRLVGEFFIERRYVVPLDDIAPVMIQAIIAAEDDRFFEHRGINFWSIVRAAIKNIRSLEIRQGGSTITQQIVKSLLLTPERSFSRKIKEAILAMRLERSLSKDEILTLYLNQIYFGRGAYGVEAAARVYFGSSARELTLAESAFLAGLPKAPNYYRTIDRALRRRRYVLLRMQEQGYIDRDEAREAAAVPFVWEPPRNINREIAPYFVEHVRRELERDYGAETLYRGGLRVETALDLDMQQAAQAAIRSGVQAYEAREHITDNATRVQAALFSLAPGSGLVPAMVGGRDFQESQFNRAVQAQRQPGSAFKPIIYAAALDKGYTSASIIVDSPLVYQSPADGDNPEEGPVFWEPQNYDKRFHGPITFRRALTQSRNIITIKILRDIGVDYVVRYAQKLGIRGTFAPDLSLSLGTCGVSLEHMVTAYSAFCAGGVFARPRYILRVLDRDGQVLHENSPRLVSALSPQTAYIMTTLLQSVVEEGTGRRVRALSRPCAGKTGTTNDVRDAWFIGYTPQLVTGVWVGFDDLAPLGRHETGAVAAAPVWLDFMQTVLAEEPVRSFSVPAGIVFVKVDADTGFYPEEDGAETIFECFTEGTQPTRFEPGSVPGLRAQGPAGPSR